MEKDLGDARADRPEVKCSWSGNPAKVDHFGKPVDGAYVEDAVADMAGHCRNQTAENPVCV